MSQVPVTRALNSRPIGSPTRPRFSRWRLIGHVLAILLITWTAANCRPQRSTQITVKVNGSGSAFNEAVKITVQKITEGPTGRLIASATISIQGQGDIGAEGSTGAKFHDQDRKFEIVFQDVKPDRVVFTVSQQAG